MPSWNLNPYGLRNGRIVYVEDLDENSEFGLNCKCTCPACGDELIARIRGEKKQKHFAHRSGADCGKAYESALHKLAKKVIEDGVEIKLPPISSSYGDRGYFVIDEVVRFPATYSTEESITPDEKGTVIEKDMGAFRPDVSIKHNGNELFIEIQVTHPVDDEKKKLIQKTDVSCVEFDFSYYKDRVLEEADIRKAFEGNDENVEVRWIYSRKKEKKDSIIQSRIESSFILNLPVTQDLSETQPKPKRGVPLSEIGSVHKIASNEGRIHNCPLRKHFDGEKYFAFQGECSDCEGFSGTLWGLMAATPFSIVCNKGDNNIEVFPEDAAQWLIYLSNNQDPPDTKEECVDLIESSLTKFGSLSNHPDLIRAKEQAIKIILSRLKEKSEERRKEEYRTLYRKIAQNLNSLIFWANSTYEVWSKFAYKRVFEFDDFPKGFLDKFTKEEVDSIVYKIARSIWETHCKEGERLYKNGDGSFQLIIYSFIDKPILDHESQKDWLYRVTYKFFQSCSGRYKHRIPSRLLQSDISRISIMPFLAKITKARFERNGTNKKQDNC